MSSFCLSFLPAVGRSKARVKYKKHVVRDEGDACFSFSSSAPHRDCTEGHVTSTSSQSSRKKKFLWKFTRLSSVVEKRSTTDLYIKIDVAQDSEGWGLFRDIDGAWRDHSFLATCLRLDELTINSAIFLSVYFSKNIKRKHEKGVIGVGFVASSGMRLQPWLTLALHVCHRQVQRRQKKKVRKHALLTFLNFGFVWQMKDFVNGNVRQSWELYFEQRVREDRCSRTDSMLLLYRNSRGATTQGVNSATGSTAAGVDVNNRSWLGFRLSVFS